MTKQMKLRSKDTQRAYTGDRDRNNFLEKKVSTHCLGLIFQNYAYIERQLIRENRRKKYFLR